MFELLVIEFYCAAGTDGEGMCEVQTVTRVLVSALFYTLT